MTSTRASNPGSPLGRLIRERQSVWLDYMHRTMLKSGELKALIEARGVRGATSNPTIFEQAIGKSDAYDDAIAALAGQKMDSEQVFETLAIEDIRMACDQFMPIYEMTRGNDGFVSMEVSPRLANDTDGSLQAARRLWKAIDRPNAMIKIPGTAAGVPAIAAALGEGININITLLFSVKMYQQVIEAYLKGVEQRMAKGSIEHLRSVASFFVSRVDTETDKRLEALKKPGQTAGLMGKAAVANAKIAYQLYVQYFEGSRFRGLMGKGAAVQRPLWASTGTKNPAYPDTKYVDELIGPDTINTMPPATLDAFADHGTVDRTVDRDVEQARRQIEAIEALGVKLDDVTDFLVKDGVKKFEDSYASLLDVVDSKRKKLAAV